MHVNLIKNIKDIIGNIKFKNYESTSGDRPHVWE